MKIASIKVLGDGMSTVGAEALWSKTESNASYQFNLSHSVEYSVLSFWTMWLRVNYAAEYFAACLSIVGEDKLTGLVKDARECGIEILPPDVNKSSHRFTIVDDNNIVSPFNSILGISDNIAIKIVELRESQEHKRFNDPAHFKKAAAEKGTKVSARVVERLELVGGLAGIAPGSKPARHPDRRKDQTELMPGLIIDVVKADRQTDMTDGFGKGKVIQIVQDYSKCQACTLKGNPHPTVRIPKSTVKFMVVSDSPSWQEEKEGKLLVGDAADFMRASITEAKLAVGEGYYTTLVKSRKTDKFLSNEQINGCKQFLERELELIKPAVIVALGSASIRFFLPDVKGGTGELAGKAFYDVKREASVVCGINPQQIAFDPSKLDALKDTFLKVAEIVL